MFYVTLMGGLGNQLFQYAFGRALSLRSGLELRLSLAFLNDRAPRKGYTPRRYELDAFSIAAPTTEREAGALFRPGVLHRIEKRLRPGTRISPRGLGFDPLLLEAVDGAIYEGYFQSERYFADCRPILLHELSPRRPLSPDSEDIARRIDETESVAVHVRRGDYVSNPAVNAAFGLCGLEYYREALDAMAGRLARPVFFFFSDDMEWVKNNLSTNAECHYVDHNRREAAWEDLVLMSRCRNNIVANSTFSWWGAWLNDHPDRMVIAPDPWFASGDVGDNIIPSGWKRLPASSKLT
jgi:hypothetical protein